MSGSEVELTLQEPGRIYRTKEISITSESRSNALDKVSSSASVEAVHVADEPHKSKASAELTPDV